MAGHDEIKLYTNAAAAELFSLSPLFAGRGLG
jgi:hypothetical protein